MSKSLKTNTKQTVDKFFTKYKNVNIGLTKISLAKNVLTISHSGNMGHNIETVNGDLRLAKFPLSIQDLKQSLKVKSESGWPDYLYEIRFCLTII